MVGIDLADPGFWDSGLRARRGAALGGRGVGRRSLRQHLPYGSERCTRLRLYALALADAGPGRPVDLDDPWREPSRRYEPAGATSPPAPLRTPSGSARRRGNRSARGPSARSTAGPGSSSRSRWRRVTRSRSRRTPPPSRRRARVDFHRYLSVAEFARRFGASPATIAAVGASLRAHGLRPGAASANGLALSLTTEPPPWPGPSRPRFAGSRCAAGRRPSRTRARPAVDGAWPATSRRSSGWTAFPGSGH